MITTILAIIGAGVTAVIFCLFIMYLLGYVHINQEHIKHDDEIEQSCFISNVILSEVFTPEQALYMLISSYEKEENHPSHNKLVAIFRTEKFSRAMIKFAPEANTPYWQRVHSLAINLLSHPEEIHEYEGE